MELTMTIAKHGDIMVTLGRESDTISNVLVCSVALSLLSPVFAAMFGGRFREGQALSTESPSSVSLLEDDPHAMLLICNIAHFRTTDLPIRLSPLTFANFAVACDKYQCAEGLQAWSKVWMTNILKFPTPDPALFTAYVLDLPEGFSEVTRSLIRDRVNHVNISDVTHCHDFLPLCIFDKLLSEKSKGESNIYESLHTLTSFLGSCDGSRKTLGNLMIRLRQAGIWPTGISSLSGLKSQITEMKDIPDPSCAIPNCRVCSMATTIKKQLVEDVKKVYDSVKGLLPGLYQTGGTW